MTGKIILISLLFSAFSAFSQPVSSRWTSSPFEHKVFIENKGQFGWVDNGSGKETKFGASFCDVDVHFSASGLTYIKTEQRSIKEEQVRKDGTKKKEKAFLKVPHYAYLEWVGANPHAVIISESIENQYFTYGSLNYNSGKTSLKTAAFKKIVYKNLYPNIDVEYTFPEDKPGIKYALILHPGADPSVIRMKYSGEITTSLSAEGNLILDVFADDIIDHAPVSFLEDSKASVHSSFRLQNDVVSFALAEYDPSKTLIVDPWTVVPTFTAYNAAYDVEYDLAGNVYVYGGRGTVGNPFQEIKYNSAGVQQWVYTWTTAIITPSYGDFAVDGASGSSYIVEGYNPPVPVVLKVNAAGNQVAIYNGNVWMNEMWRVVYNNCTKTMIIAGGGTGGTTYQAVTIDSNLTAMTPYNVLSATTDLHDISLLAIDNANNYYMATAKSAIYPAVLDNLFLKGPATTILPRAYMLPDNHAFLEVGSIGYIANQGVLPTAYANGFNGMAVSAKYLYTYDGSTIRRWNKLTGAFINSAVISPTPFLAGGLAVDECDNIFAGVLQSVVQLDTNFNTIATTVVPNNVYDVRLGPGNLLYACGNQFVSSFNVTLPTCSTLSATVSAGGSCASGTATVTATGGSAPYSYIWNPSGQTSSVASGLTTGNYTVTVFDGGCSPSSKTLTVTVNSGAITSSVTSTPANCLLSNGTATVSPTGGTPSYTYSWSPTGGNNSIASGLGPGAYTVTVTDASGCTGTATVNITAVGGATVSVSGQANISCNGGNNGTASISATGGTSPYTYSWSPSGGSSSAATGLSASTYTVLVTDASGCTQSQTLTITEPAALTAVSTSTATSCGTSTGLASVNASGGTGTLSYSWTPSGGNNTVATGLGVGTYTVLVTDANGCTISSSIAVAALGGPTSSLSSQTGVSCNGGSNGSAAVAAAGGTAPYTYLWNPTAAATATATGLSAGNYTCVVTDATGCSGTVTVSITQPAAISASATSTATPCGQSNGSAAVTGSGGTGAFTYSWTPSGGNNSTATGLAQGSYTAIVTDANGCTGSAVAVVGIMGGPAANAGISVTIIDGTSTTLAGTGGGTYSWNPSAGLSCSTCSNPAVSPSVTTTYTLIVTDANGCTDTAEVTVFVEPVACSNKPNAGKFYLPNAFSPNGDGENDDLCLMGWDECLKEFSIKIFNRWGELVFESDERSFCWDGTKNGNPLNTGAFAFTAKAILYNDTEKDMKGNISLIR